MIRHDFSFPPKSASSVNKNVAYQQQHSVHNYRGYHNHNQLALPSHHQAFPHQQHHQHQRSGGDNNCNHYNQQPCPSENSASHGVGLCKSASTSLLSGAASHAQNNNTCYFNNNNNNNNDNVKGQSSCASCSSRDAHHVHDNKNPGSKPVVNAFPSRYNAAAAAAAAGSENHLRASASSGSIMQGPVVAPMDPTTPKDSDCSFTFDDLKSTLAFMDDSPLVNAAGSNGMINGKTGNGMMPPSGSSQQESESKGQDAGAAQPSFGPSGGNSLLPKSSSNPGIVLISSGSSSNSSTANTSPTSSSSSLNSHTILGQLNDKKASKPDCACANESSRGPPSQTSYQQSLVFTNAPMDLMKKSNSDLLIDRSSGTNKLAGNGLLSLISNSQPQHHQQQGPPAHQQSGNINNAIENAAKKYRCAAQISEATCCWKGKLPPKQYRVPIIYSTKVFVGGLPWDITEDDLIKEFGVFGPCRVEWTNKEKYNLLSNANGNALNASNQFEAQGFNNNNNGSNNNSSFRSHKSLSNLQPQSMHGNYKQMPYNGSNGNASQQGNQNGNDSVNGSKQRMSPGFAYVIYENEYSVRTLVSNCIEDYQNGRDRVEYYFKISTRRVRNKEVQIIPWILADNNIALCTPKELDPKKTVFVGNLHGTMTARDLAHIMNELFGCVLYAGIDIDKLKYPIGSGRVTFSHQQNFMKAVRAAFVDIQSSKFTKRIQIDPYLEDVQCCVCMGDKGVYFCRDFQCFNYYCGRCWDTQHSYDQQMGTHKPLMRKREDKVN